MLGCPHEYLAYLAYLAYIPVPIALSYPILVKILRNRRTQKLQKSLGYDNNTTAAEIYERISLPDAQAVMLNMSLFEFPKFFEVALQFALFRTYAIPTISAILAKTRQLADTKNAPKRYVDTAVLIAEFTRWPMDSERASLAIARMNYLHSQHPSIRPIDTLYTLLLFATQPIVFIELYEWRKPTALEKVAMWKFWTEIGIRMNIPADTIPKTWDGMLEWSEAFERTDMVPSESNNFVGVHTVELLLYWVPNSPLKTFGKQCVYGILDERLHTAMGFPKPHWVIPHILNFTLGTRKFVLRHLTLPRIWRTEKLLAKPNPQTGLYNAYIVDVEPWYVPVTFWGRYGPWGWISWVGGWPVLENGRWKSEGYDIAQVGPKGFEGRGKETVIANAEHIRAMGMGGSGCPFG